MAGYQQILLALELNEECDAYLIKKAKEFVAQFNAQLTVVHAVEQLSTYGAAYAIPIGIDVQESILRDAEKTVAQIGTQLNIPKDRQIVKISAAKYLILEEAKRIKADLIIIGSHGRHGVELLLGSSANAVLHHATCDVLAVRVHESS